MYGKLMISLAGWKYNLFDFFILVYYIVFQGFILASFFYGYIVTQIPGGYLATR